MLIEGRRRIDQERVRIYWETGLLIHTHVLKNKDRAEYGAEVVVRLAKDTGVDKTVLHRCLRFARTYPRLPIVARGQQFSWSHYRKLITISDDKKRSALEEAAGRHQWSSEELAGRIRSRRLKGRTSQAEKSPVPQKPLMPLRGELYTYRIIERPTLGPGEDSGLLVDCGFGFFRNVEPRAAAQLKKDDIVGSVPKEDAYRLMKTGRAAKDLFTYRAYVEKVVDGDTLKVRLDLGFDSWCRQVLRLRGLDCPEIDTKEGAAAKAFVQSYLKEASVIIARSSRSDKYDRYLADVFIPHPEKSARYPEQAPKGRVEGPADVFILAGEGPEAETDLYLNNLLLENGHAVRMS